MSRTASAAIWPMATCGREGRGVSVRRRGRGTRVAAWHLTVHPTTPFGALEGGASTVPRGFPAAAGRISTMGSEFHASRPSPASGAGSPCRRAFAAALAPRASSSLSSSAEATRRRTRRREWATSTATAPTSARAIDGCRYSAVAYGPGPATSTRRR